MPSDVDVDDTDPLGVGECLIEEKPHHDASSEGLLRGAGLYLALAQVGPLLINMLAMAKWPFVMLKNLLPWHQVLIVLSGLSLAWVIIRYQAIRS